MTLSVSTSRVRYVGTGSVDAYTVPFKFHADAELAVYELDLAGVESLYVLTTDYTVTGAGEDSGGEITLVAGNLAAGVVLVIIRDVPETQATDYVELANFPADSHEDALDKLTMLVQQLQEQMSRAVLLPVTVDATLPEIEDSDSDDIVIYDGSGNLIASGSEIADFISKAVANEYTAQQNFDAQAITSSSNLTAWNLNEEQCATLVLAENTTLSNPTNLKDGGTYMLRIVQGAGPFTLAFDTAFDFGEYADPDPPAANGDVLILSFYSNGVKMYGGVFNRSEA